MRKEKLLLRIQAVGYEAKQNWTDSNILFMILYYLLPNVKKMISSINIDGL